MSLIAVQAALEARLGLDSAITGDSHVRVAVSRTLRRLGYEDVGRLASELQTVPEAWRTLVEEVVVSESWFFRDGAPFTYLTTHLRDSAFPKAPVRVLSMPCATGEEAYSVAIALLEAGVPSAPGSVLAADVSARAVAAARAGVYTARAFRGGGEVLRDRYFTAERTRGRWQVRSDVRELVDCRVANAVTGEGLDGVGRFDIVLCRNLLIYLSECGRAAVLRRLRSVLRADGVLVVGHAEPAIVREHGFKAVGPVSAFAFALDRPKNQADAQSAAGGRSWPPAAALVPAPTGTFLPEVPDEWLLRARALADQGRHGEALAMCETGLRLASPSADAYVTLGLLHDAMGQGAAAEEATRRALYLDPLHPAALAHQALKAEARGDHAAASRLRRRARRHANSKGAA